MTGRVKHEHCRNLSLKVNRLTNHTVDIEEYPERPSDLTIDGAVYKRISNTKIYEMLEGLLNEEGD
jgi:hypothetical protein